jgi:hypothetical protein
MSGPGPLVQCKVTAATVNYPCNTAGGPCDPACAPGSTAKPTLSGKWGPPLPLPGLDPGRPLSELSDSGLLWLINRVVFHPRGYSLALHVSDPDTAGVKTVTGWSIQGTGADVWVFGPGVDEDAMLAKVREVLGP